MEDSARQWLREWFVKRHEGSLAENEISDTANFFEAGYIDSMGVVSLILDIESHFGFSFTQENYMDRRFSSISGLSEMIDSIKGAQ